MRLIPLTLAQWQHERRWEAAECAARVQFADEGRIALFLDRDRHLLYTRIFRGSECTSSPRS
jgi:hypothetical protein